MSLSRLASQAGIAEARSSVARNASSPTGGAAGPLAGTFPTDERFALLTKFIPTETITLFLAVVSAIDAIAKIGRNGGSTSLPSISPWAAYWVFAALTPLIVLGLARVAYKDELRRLNAPAAAPPFRPPSFEMLAAFLAFLIWALAVPGMAENAVWQIVASVGAVIVSTFLNLVEGFFK